MDRIDALRALSRSVELGSFSAAARELGVGQSTVSKWVAALEEELGARLLDRSTRSQRLTPEGEAFLEQARGVLSAWERAQEAARGGALEGEISLSLPVVFGGLHVQPLLPAFLRAHPGVRLRLLYSDHYVDLIREGVDLAVRVGAPRDSSFRGRTLAHSERVLVASPEYLAARGRPSSPEQLADHACLLHPHVGPGSWRLGWEGRWRDQRVSGPVQADNSAALLAFARQGFGLALLARWLVAPELATGRLCALLPEAQWAPAPVRVILPPGRGSSPRVQALVEHLAQGLAGVG